MIAECRLDQLPPETTLVMRRERLTGESAALPTVALVVEYDEDDDEIVVQPLDPIAFVNDIARPLGAEERWLESECEEVRR